MLGKRIESVDDIQQRIKKNSLWSYKVYLVYLSLLFASLIPLFLTDDLRLLITKAVYLPIFNVDVPIKEYSIGIFSIAIVILAYLKFGLMRVLMLIRFLPQDALPDEKIPLALWLDSISQNPWRMRLTVLFLSFGLPAVMIFITVWSVRLSDMKISYPQTSLIVLAWLAVMVLWHIPSRYRVYQPSSTPLDSFNLKRSIDASFRYMARMETSVNMWKGVLTALVIVFVIWFHGSLFSQVERGEVFAFDLSDRNIEAYFSNLNTEERWRLNRVPLNNANFEGANLSGVTLSWAKLRGANFRFATLVDADLSDAYFQGADFTQAILTNVKIWGADIQNTNFAFADLRSLDTVSLRIEDSNFESADLSSSNIIHAIFQNTVFSRATMHGVHFAASRFFNTDFSGVDFEGAELLNSSSNFSNFTDTNFKNADLNHMKFYRANLTNTNFGNANLYSAQFGGSDLSNTIFDGANLSHANFLGILPDMPNVESAHNLLPSQLYNVQSLHQAMLPPEIEAALLETHPHLFEPLEETQQ